MKVEPWEGRQFRSWCISGDAVPPGGEGIPGQFHVQCSKVPGCGVMTARLFLPGLAGLSMAQKRKSLAYLLCRHEGDLATEHYLVGNLGIFVPIAPGDMCTWAVS